MSRIELVPASLVHVGPIATRMRAEDVEEARAFGHSPKSALRIGLRNSSVAFTAKVDGRPEAMFGLVPVSLIEGEGTPWMLCTDEVYRHGRAVLGIGRDVVGWFLDSTPRLAQVVSQSNVRAIRLLKAWGFTVEDDVRMIGGVPFLDFWMERG